MVGRISALRIYAHAGGVVIAECSVLTWQGKREKRKVNGSLGWLFLQDNMISYRGCPATTVIIVKDGEWEKREEVGLEVCRAFI